MGRGGAAQAARVRARTSGVEDEAVPALGELPARKVLPRVLRRRAAGLARRVPRRRVKVHERRGGRRVGVVDVVWVLPGEEVPERRGDRLHLAIGRDAGRVPPLRPLGGHPMPLASRRIHVGRVAGAGVRERCVAATDELARGLVDRNPLGAEGVGSSDELVGAILAHDRVERVASAARVAARPPQEECVHARCVHVKGEIEARHREGALAVDVVVGVAVVGKHLRVLPSERAGRAVPALLRDERPPLRVADRFARGFVVVIDAVERRSNVVHLVRGEAHDRAVGVGAQHRLPSGRRGHGADGGH